MWYALNANWNSRLIGILTSAQNVRMDLSLTSNVQKTIATVGQLFFGKVGDIIIKTIIAGEIDDGN